MKIHSLLLIQLNTARVVAILTPHLTARALSLSRTFIQFLLKGKLCRVSRQRKHSTDSRFTSIKTYRSTSLLQKAHNE
jgi:hypothetical protein